MNIAQVFMIMALFCFLFAAVPVGPGLAYRAHLGWLGLFLVTLVALIGHGGVTL